MNPGPVIAIIALIVPMVVGSLAIILRYVYVVRRLEHEERMKALEMGRTLPQDEAWWSTPRIAIAIGAFVPVAALSIAVGASESGNVVDDLWPMAGMVSLAGIIGGTILSVKHFNHKSAMEIAALHANPYPQNGKPASFDPDAYDVASNRG